MPRSHSAQANARNESSTLLDWIGALQRFGDRPAVVAMGKNEVNQASCEQLDDLSRRFAAGLRQRNIDREELVPLLAPASTVWIAACLGIMRAGATPVPLDVQFDDDALMHIFDDCQPRWVLADRRSKARLAELNLESKFDVILLNEEDGEQSWRRWLTDKASELPRAEPDDDAILFYTSGTTGPPKGVPLTHENIATQIEVLLGADLVSDRDRVLLPLPLHHVYPLVVGMLTPLARGLPIVLPYSLTGPQMVRALNETDATILIGVPRLYRALYDGILAKAESSGRIAGFAARIARTTSLWLRRRLGIRAGKWLLRPLHRQFGPNLRVVACGGSPLDDELAWNLEAIGWQVAIGYGLTETSPLLTLNPPGKAKIGTVGTAISNVELSIDVSDDGMQVNGHPVGEILARGPSVFSGYRNLPKKTEESFSDDGWFRTGDLGFFDDDDYLHVTGRHGTMIVTEGGENVQPDDVEDAYAGHPAIREIGVLEVDRKLVALIVPETSELDGEDLQESIAQAVATRGRDMPSYQRISDFHWTRQALPRTRLGKIQRHKLRERFEQAANGESETSQEPIAIEEMASDDRALLNDPAAREVWNLLAQKYADRHLTPDTSLQLDLGVDSLEWMNLSLAIRRHAAVEMDEEAIARVETVRDLLQEAGDAAAADEHAEEFAPLENPEAALSKDQLRYMKPHGRFLSLLARCVFSGNWLFMRLAFRLESRGQDSLPHGPVVIAPNHVSYLDAPAVAAALPWHRLRNTYWGGWTGTMFTNFVMRWISRLTHVVPVDPQRGAMSSLAFGAAVLDQNHSLVWFPEGGRSTDGTLQAFRPGIGLLLKSRDVSVVPTVIDGAHEALPPGSWLPRPHKIRVTFGQPLTVDALVKDADDSDAHEQIAASLRDCVAKMAAPTNDEEDPS